MAKTYYVPLDDPGKCSWLNNFAQKLSTYAETLAVTPGEVASAQADNAFFAYVCDARNQLNQYAMDWTAYKNRARNGTALGALPTPPALPEPPTPQWLPMGRGFAACR